MSTPPTSTPWVPIWPKKGFESIVNPPQDGKWAQGLNGRVTWVPQPAFPTGDTGWHIFGEAGEPALQNGWAHYVTPYGPCRFRKLSDNLVIMEGLIVSGPAGVVAFQMPVGYRPMILSGGDYISHRMLAQSGVYAWGSGHMYADGRFVPQTGAGNWISLSNFRYYAE